ncbi:hypothetical protein [Limnohabitans sp.]|uniref:hypothetical protein n=1 Tax=Limnohabitans sp. TaxID=1907725 RepID=UPI00286F47DC|nr:hypothetical protein [Limnohabitans sp.]
MPSLREQVLAATHAALTSAAPGGASVFRSRETSITRDKTPAIVITPGGTERTRHSDILDKSTFTFKAEIFVRGDPWDQLADVVDVPMHAALMSSSALSALCVLRRTNEEFESVEADKTAGTLTATYRATFTSSAFALDKPF